jgi:23S rRNA G2069 N7-methylase RlmK/C1962 C5-methylase RlmI
VELEKSIYFAKNGAREVVSVDFSLGQLSELEKKS